MSKRAIRRYHRTRLARKLRRDDYYGFASDKGCAVSSDDISLHYKKHIDNPKKCSCFMCGNPRKWSKSKESLTLQERKAQNSHTDYLKDIV